MKTTRVMKRIRSAFFALTLIALAGTAQAVTHTWTNKVGGLWSDAANWDVPPVSAEDTVILFTNKGPYAVTNDLTADPFILNRIVFTNASGTITLAAGTNLSFQGANAGVWEIGSGVLVINNVMDLATNIIVSGDVNFDSTSPITGTGAMTVTSGTSTLRMTAGNTFSGGIIITNSGSRVAITSGGAPYRLCGGPITIHSGWTNVWSDNLGSVQGPLLDHCGSALTNAINLCGGMICAWRGDPTHYNGPLYLDDNPRNAFTLDWTLNVNGQVTGPGGFMVAPAGKARRSCVITNLSNTFKGPVLIAGTQLSTPQFNSVNSGRPSALGSPDTVANGTIHLGYIGVQWATAATLYYTGTNETTDRVINLPGKTLGVAITHAGPAGNLLKFTSDFTVPGVDASDCRKTLTLSVTQATSTMEIAGTIPDATLGNAGQKATSITKSGAGTVTFSGTNTYSGATLVNGGKLAVSGSIANTASLTITNAAVSLSAKTCLSTNTTIYLRNAGTMNLNYSGRIYGIPAIYTNGVLLGTGTYGAAELPTFLTGTGYISTFKSEPGTLISFQ